MSSVVIGCVLFSWVAAYVITKKNLIYRYPAQGWLDINTHPFPDTNNRYNEILVTDGKDVSTRYTATMSYSKDGKPFLNQYTKSYITHWQPFPAPPNKLEKWENIKNELNTPS